MNAQESWLGFLCGEGGRAASDAADASRVPGIGRVRAGFLWSLSFIHRLAACLPGRRWLVELAARRWLSASVIAIFACALLVCLFQFNCGRPLESIESPAALPTTNPALSASAAKPAPSAPPVRPVRVLIASDAEQLRLRAPGAEIRDCASGAKKADVGADWFGASMEHGAMRISGIDGAMNCAVIVPRENEVVSVATFVRDYWGLSGDYPGKLMLQMDRLGAIDAINEVDLEDYVAAVVAQEAAGSFEQEALRGQAIIARSFALYLMNNRAPGPYDVTCTQGSQVYKGRCGADIGRRATDAANYTRGVVCTFMDNGQERLLPTYYSSCCGGLSQSATIFDGAGTAGPLRGGVYCDYCRCAPAGSYRWGPVKLSRREVMERLLQRFPNAASLREVKSIETVQRTSAGRPLRFRLLGTSGESMELPAENFRLAIGAMTMKSTDCDVRVAGKEVIFENGRGFGHGLGLCQWGMQGQAKMGKKAADILRYYYPGSRLSRAY